MATTTEVRGKWRVELNEARESDLPSRLEPIGFSRGVVAEKVRRSSSCSSYLPRCFPLSDLLTPGEHPPATLYLRARRSPTAR